MLHNLEVDSFGGNSLFVPSVEAFVVQHFKVSGSRVYRLSPNP